MPSIDNTLVRQQTAELLPLFNQPAEFLKRLRRMLQQHADPMLRQSLVVAINSPLNGYGTPLPVLKTIRNAIRKPAERTPDLGLALADALWAAQSREERWLAAEILGLIADLRPTAVTERMTLWLNRVENIDVADALASSAGGPWLRSDVPQNLQTIRKWLTIGDRYQQRFAVMCLVWLAEDRTYSDVLAILDSLPSSLHQIDPEVRNSMARLLRELSLKNAGLVAKFLRDWANTLDRNAHWVVRHALENLDTDTRQELLVLLRGRG